MHSLRALSASAFDMPLVFSLHIAILLLGFSAAAGFAERQVFMNAWRSSPFLSPAFSLHIFIFSCCEFGLLSEALVSAAAVLVSVAVALVSFAAALVSVGAALVSVAAALVSLVSAA